MPEISHRPLLDIFDRSGGNANGRRRQGEIIGLGTLDIVRLAELNPGPEKKYAFLSEVLAASSSPRLKKIAELSHSIVRSPQEAEERKNEPDTDLRMALAIRALDYGMMHLPLDLRYAFFSELLQESPDTEQIAESWDLRADCHTERMHHKKRYEQFVEYFAELSDLYKDRPNILLIYRGKGYTDKTGGMFTEYDFWVEHATQENAGSLPGKTLKQLATEAPKELLGRNEPWLAFDRSLKKLRSRFGLLAMDLRQYRRESRKTAVRNYIQENEDGHTLRLPTNEIAQELQIPESTISEEIIRLQKASDEILTLPRRTSPQLRHAIALSQIISRAICDLDRPGHQWKYGQYTYGALADYINVTLIPTLDKETLAIVGTFVPRYTLIHTAQQYMYADSANSHERIPKIERTNRKSVRETMKKDICALVREGFPQNPEAIRDRLHLMTYPETRSKRQEMKMRVIELLAELKKEEGI